MKNFIFYVIFGLINTISSIWVIVSFILYLVKNQPFQWLSVIVCVLSLILTVIYFFLTIKKIN